MMLPYMPISMIKDPFDLNSDMRASERRWRYEPEMPTFRQLLGRAFIRAGAWLEGRKPRAQGDPSVAAA
jgi:hypothetical protein